MGEIARQQEIENYIASIKLFFSKRRDLQDAIQEGKKSSYKAKEQKDRLLQLNAQLQKEETMKQQHERSMQKYAKGAEEAKQYIPCPNKNLLDDSVYEQEERRIVERRQNAINDAVEQIKDDIKEKREVLSLAISAIEADSSTDFEKPSPFSEVKFSKDDHLNVKTNRSRLVENMQELAKKGSDAKLLSEEVLNSTISEAKRYNKEQTVQSLFASLKKVPVSVENLITNEKEDYFKNNKTNKIMLPAITAAAIMVALIVLFQVINVSLLTNSAAVFVPTLFLSLIIGTVFTVGSGYVIIVDEDVSMDPPAYIAIFGGGIALLVFSYFFGSVQPGFLNFIIAWGIRIAVICGIGFSQFALWDECGSNIREIVYCGVAFVWLRFIMHFQVPSIFYGMSNLLIHFVLPIVIGIIAFFVAQWVFTKTALRNITGGGYEKESTRQEIAFYEQHKEEYIVLFHYSALAAEYAKTERLSLLKKETAELDDIAVQNEKKEKASIINLDYSRQCRGSGKKPHSYCIYTAYCISSFK